MLLYVHVAVWAFQACKHLKFLIRTLFLLGIHYVSLHILV